MDAVINGKVHSIDAGMINGRPFFSVCGVGFDAVVSERYAKSGKRGIISYIEQGLHTWREFKPEKYTLTVDGTVNEIDAALITVGNSSQWGNGAMIAKIVIGAIFFVSGFTTGSVGPTLVGVIIGLGLIAWGLLPMLLPRIQAKKEAEAAEAARKAEEERLANEPKACPACGAHTKGHVCEYCGEPLK